MFVSVSGGGGSGLLCGQPAYECVSVCEVEGVCVADLCVCFHV